MIARGIDYAVVACPTGMHEEVGLELAAAGVGALVEKPLAESLAAAQKLVEAFESAGLVAGVGHIERYNPALQSLRSRLEAGDLGEVYQVVTRRQGPFPHRIADVGVVKDLATHDIDLTAWVTGENYASVSARTFHKSGRPHEDMVSVTADLTGGAIVSHLVNWLSPFKERFTAVTGSAGCFIADTLTGDLSFHANGVQQMGWEALASFRGVSEGDSHPLRPRQAGAAARRARAVPRRDGRRGSGDRHPARGPAHRRGRRGRAGGRLDRRHRDAPARRAGARAASRAERANAARSAPIGWIRSRLPVRRVAGGPGRRSDDGGSGSA